MVRIRQVLSGENTTPVQGEIPGFEQKKVVEIEKWAVKYDETRETINRLDGDLSNAEMKLRESMHANEDKVDRQESEDGDKLLVYKRGDFNIVCKRGKEKVNVKVGEKSKGGEEGGATDGEA